MSRSSWGGIQALIIWCAAVAVLAGADSPPKKAKGTMPDLRKETLPKGEETVRDLAYLHINKSIRVEGIGLVIGLEGTGSSPEPSIWRAKLVDRMKKAGVINAEKWLESGTCSLVLVEGTVPEGVSPKDRWDVDLKLTPASTTKSLEGGFLLMTPLNVMGIVDGQSLEGQHIADVYGPVLVGSTTDEKNLRVGRVLGGAHSRKEMPYILVLKDDRKGYRSADLLQRTINSRFHERKGVEQIGMAVAKSPETIVLSVPKVYHDNQFRYFQVVERLHLVENPDLRARRQEQWAKELLEPTTAGNAALELEGIGRNSIDVLKTGLASSDPRVQFFAAEALAYLHDASGVDVLAKSAVDNADFRAFALAALAAMDEPAAVMRLRELMSKGEPQVRYGAFSALRTADPHDPFLGHVRLLREAPAHGADDESGTDAMALRVYSAPHHEPPPDDPFDLYLVASDGPPMIHVTHNRRREVVVFGREQKLLTPAVLGSDGQFLVNAALDDDKIEISRVRTGDDDRRTVTKASLSEVIRGLALLGASYPDVLLILQRADRQKNLQGPLIVDALPPPRDGYEKAQLAGALKKDEAVSRASLGKNKSQTRKSLIDRLRFWRTAP